MKQYPGTIFLLASLVLLFGVELILGATGNDDRLLALGAIPDTGMIGAQYWRLLTYGWLHAGYLHLATNGALLFWVGRIVERRTGTLLMLGIYLGCAVAGGVLIIWKASIYPKPGTSIGASAAVSGLLACALVLLHRPSAAAFGRAVGVRVALWAILVFGLAISFLPGVSLAGHAGGLILGAFFGLFVPVRCIEAGKKNPISHPAEIPDSDQ
jgi:rhomboid protease GluP